MEIKVEEVVEKDAVVEEVEDAVVDEEVVQEDKIDDVICLIKNANIIIPS
jgi:hypothetical protein